MLAATDEVLATPTKLTQLETRRDDIEAQDGQDGREAAAKALTPTLKSQRPVISTM